MNIELNKVITRDDLDFLAYALPVVLQIMKDAQYERKHTYKGAKLFMEQADNQQKQNDEIELSDVTVTIAADTTEGFINMSAEETYQEALDIVKSYEELSAIIKKGERFNNKMLAISDVEKSENDV